MITNYLKIAWKVLLRHPFYTFVTLFGISLTLTVLIVLTSFLDHLIGNHYPENRRDRTLYIQRVTLGHPGNPISVSTFAGYGFIKKYVQTLKTPEKIGFTTIGDFANAYVEGRRIKLTTKHTDAGFWEVADFRFSEGKPYTDRHIAGGEHVAVITDGLKAQYFGLDSGPVVGKTVEVDNVRHRIIGVVEAVPVTRPITSADIYVPYNVSKSDYARQELTGDYVALLLARRKADQAAIREEFNQVVSRIPKPYVMEGGEKYELMTVRADTYLEGFLSILGPSAELFYAVVTLVMLMFMALPTINLVNLNVSRIMERASEIGIRKAFGAPARTLVWQFIIENIFITFLGGVIALILSLGVIAFINRSGWIAYADLTINFGVFGASLAMCLVFGFLSGVVPALRMARLNIVAALKVA